MLMWCVTVTCFLYRFTVITISMEHVNPNSWSIFVNIGFKTFHAIISSVYPFYPFLANFTALITLLRLLGCISPFTSPNKKYWYTFRTVHQIPHCGDFLLLLKSQMNHTQMIDPRFEDEALSALMEEALSQTTEETKFDVDAYFNSDIEY